MFLFKFLDQSQKNTFLLFYIFFDLFVLGAPSPVSQSSATFLSNLYLRADPVFPNDPPSCLVCAKSYPSINSCAEAAPVLANFTNIIFNPGKFVDVIKCACADTFQAAFPQCVDCFIKTGQEDILSTTDLPSVLSGMRKICGIESTLLGNVSATANSSETGGTAPAIQTGGAATGVVIRIRDQHALWLLNFFLILLVA
ncbi:hypothetical protein BDQ17DRAFT_1308365 [Cyathus striatus]|nr:hypothetical protein BDQ17DRAFT_1308365 [Cyathus striatus]